MARKILIGLAGVNVTLTLGALVLVVVGGFHGDVGVMQWAILLAIFNILLLLASRAWTRRRR